MAMNKKEIASVLALESKISDLKNDVFKAKALSWPSYKPIPIDTHSALKNEERKSYNGRDYVEAWTFNVYNMDVLVGGFNEVFHFTISPLSWSQGRGSHWYKTRKEALMALRIALTEKYAGTLALIDQKIDNCEV